MWKWTRRRGYLGYSRKQEGDTKETDYINIPTERTDIIYSFIRDSKKKRQRDGQGVKDLEIKKRFRPDILLNRDHSNSRGPDPCKYNLEKQKPMNTFAYMLAWADNLALAHSSDCVRATLNFHMKCINKSERCNR